MSRPLIPTDWSREQADLVKRMLIKNPADRIRMSDIRVSYRVEYADGSHTHG